MLHLDRNEYYGGEGASLSLSQVNYLFKIIILTFFSYFKGLDLQSSMKCNTERIGTTVLI